MDNFNTGLGLDNFTQGTANTQPGMDPSMYQNRRTQIANMPPGPQKEAALAALLRDYQGEQSAAEGERDTGFEMMMEGAPQGTQTGGKYGTFVAANPLEHLAAGLRTFKGARQMRDAKTKLGELSEQQQKARTDLFRAGLGGTPMNIYNRP